MGLFVAEDGSLRGWLAALLCCWAAMGEDEYDAEKTKTKASISRPVTCNEQPTPKGAMPQNLRTLAAFRDASFNEDDLVRPISERPPSLKPLDFGETSLMSKVSLHGRRKSSTTLLAALTSPKRISIGQPLNFRRLDYTEKQRRSLIPLQLEPVVLRHNDNGSDAHLTHADHDQGLPQSAEVLSDTVDRHSYREARGTPWQRCQQTSGAAASEETKDGAHLRDSVKKQQAARPVLSTRSSSSSIRSLRRQASDPNVSSTSVNTQRASMDRGRLRRKRSNQLSFSDNQDIDREILELNTIVEERRMEALRPQSPGHIPAVAPRMRSETLARSETLSSIGSAFSRPLRLDTTCQTIQESASPMKSPIKSRLSRPFTNMPDTTVTTEDAGVVRRPSSRVTGWLSGLLKDPSTSTTQSAGPGQFYACNAPIHQRAVSGSSVTETDSPCFTATSSPVSKAHSRSLTSDSRITTLSPPSTACTSEFDARELRKKGGEQWRGHVDHPSQVGLAM